jgi:membrane protease YdiL (CAAX protease family)
MGADDGSGGRRPAWDGGRAILYFILAALSSLLISVLLLEPLGFHGSVIVSEVLVFGAIPMALSVFFATGWRQWFSKPVVSHSMWPWALVAVLSFVVAQNNLLVLFDRLYPIPTSQLEFFRKYLAAETPVGLLGVLCVAALVPAVFEEVAFRGLIQSGLRLSYGPRHAVVWTGLLFATLHMNPWNFISLWSLGCFLGYITERTGSIRPAIFLHLVNNTFALVLLFLQGREGWDSRPEFIPWYWSLLAGAVMVFALWKVHRLTEKVEPLMAGAQPGYPAPPIDGETLPPE